MKIWKAALGVGAAAGLTEYAIAEYFFRRTMIRQNASVERTMDMAGTNWELYIPEIQKCREWMMEQPHQEVAIQSRDGLKLHATFFPMSKEAKGQPRLVICFHGYTGKGMSDFSGLSNYYLPQGYAMLLVDARAHGDSEGEYVGFGCLDRIDAREWIDYAQKLMGPDCEIWLHGVSMGGSTVLMVSGLELPDCVKGIISDCAFTSAWDVFYHVLKNQYHMWPDPVLKISDWMCRKRAGYGLNQCNAAVEVKKAKVPILFIHGEDDTFVPKRMCHEIYANCKSDKEVMIVPGAGHVESFYKARKQYEERLTGFLHKTGGVQKENQ